MNPFNGRDNSNRNILQSRTKGIQTRQQNNLHLGRMTKSQHNQLLGNRYQNQLIRSRTKGSPANTQNRNNIRPFQPRQQFGRPFPHSRPNPFHSKHINLSQKRQSLSRHDQHLNLLKQYGRPFSSPKPKQQLVNRVNQPHGRTLPPYRPNQQAANRSHYTQTLQQHRKPFNHSQPIPPMANQLRQPPQLKNTNRTPLPPPPAARVNQQLSGRSQYSNLLQQHRKPFMKNQTSNRYAKNSKFNHRPGGSSQKTKPNPRMRNRYPRASGVNSKPIFFTPHELLRMAPIQDRAMWELIISRLPSDYSIPDPKFIHLYQSFKKQNNNRSRKR